MLKKNAILSLSSALLVMAVVLGACSDKYQLKLQSPKTIKISEKLALSVKERSGQPIDSVAYFVNGQRVENAGSIDLSKERLGKNSVSATIYFGDQSKQLNNTIYFMAAEPPRVMNFEIVNEYPHDSEAFTQGFVYHDGYFYESTGQYGKSSLRKVEIETGKVVKMIELDKKYFGEGLTIIGDKIYQLTWQRGIGFIYDLESFELEGSFDYGRSKQGWGLTYDGNRLIKTDGTERMWFLDPIELKELNYIETYTNKRKAEKLNELEFIGGKIYANIWQQNSILIVNPENGAIEVIVNLKGLQAKAGQSGEDNVLNGIAYDDENNRLFVTGKNWNKVFEIALIEK